METVAKQYVEFSQGDYFVTGSRVLLEGLVTDFLDGRSPETIQQSFPTLKLAQVYGAITFYLDHQAEINAYLQQRGDDYEARRQANISQQPDFQRLLQKKTKDHLANFRVTTIEISLPQESSLQPGTPQAWLKALKPFAGDVAAIREHFAEIASEILTR